MQQPTTASGRDRRVQNLDVQDVSGKPSATLEIAPQVSARFFVSLNDKPAQQVTAVPVGLPNYRIRMPSRCNVINPTKRRCFAMAVPYRNCTTQPTKSKACFVVHVLKAVTKGPIMVMGLATTMIEDFCTPP